MDTRIHSFHIYCLLLPACATAYCFPPAAPLAPATASSCLPVLLPPAAHLLLLWLLLLPPAACLCYCLLLPTCCSFGCCYCLLLSACATASCCPPVLAPLQTFRVPAAIQRHSCLHATGAWGHTHARCPPGAHSCKDALQGHTRAMMPSGSCGGTPMRDAQGLTNAAPPLLTPSGVWTYSIEYRGLQSQQCRDD